MTVTPARVASLLAGLSTLGASLAPAIANLDTTSTAGLLGGAVVILGILDRFLVGQRAHEARATSTTPPAALVSNFSTTGAPQSAWSIAPAMITTVPPTGTVKVNLEPGDADAVPHLPVTRPSEIPADQGDAGTASP